MLRWSYRLVECVASMLRGKQQQVTDLLQRSTGKLLPWNLAFMWHCGDGFKTLCMGSSSWEACDGWCDRVHLDCDAVVRSSDGNPVVKNRARTLYPVGCLQQLRTRESIRLDSDFSCICATTAVDGGLVCQNRLHTEKEGIQRFLPVWCCARVGVLAICLCEWVCVCVCLSHASRPIVLKRLNLAFC